MNNVSELWQRLRAARAKAQMTQAQVARAMGLSRPAVTLWESREPQHRTVPTAEQLVELARMFGVPVTFLLDNSAGTEEVWGLGRADNTQGERTQEQDNSVVVGAAFWAAVRYAVLAGSPAYARSFDVKVSAANIVSTVGFLHGRTLASFVSAASWDDLKEMIKEEGSALLWAEKTIGKTHSKQLLVWGPEETLKDIDVAGIESRFGLTLKAFDDVGAAAAHLAQA